MKCLNQKGFFSFIIVLALSSILLTNNIEQSNLSQELNIATKELVKNELSHKDKTLLENNTDTIILAKLTEQMRNKNFNLDLAKNEINKKLNNYLENKTESFDKLTKEKGKTTITFLNKNTKTIIYEIEDITYGEYVFTSNETKTSNIRKEIGDKTKQEFLLPIGHTTRVILVNGVIQIR